MPEARIEQLLEELPQAVFDGISPYCRPELLVINFDDKQVLSIKVYPGNKKNYFMKSKGIPKGVYIRIGSHSMPANADIINDLQRSNTSVSYDHEVAPNCSMADFNNLVLTSHYGASPTEEQLMADKALVYDPISKSLVPSITGCLFFHKTPFKSMPCAEVLFSKFNGNNMDDLARTKDYSGPLVQMANEILPDIKKDLLESDQIVDAQLQSKVTLLPMEALREVLNNALIHHKYFIQDSIKIALFHDRIEVYSPGNFPGQITDFYSGVSYTRNPTIRQLARNINLVEKRGLGFRKMFDACKKNGNPSPFISDQNGDFVKVCLFFTTKASAYNFDSWPAELLPLQSFFESRESFTLTQIAKNLTCSKNTAKKRLAFLLENKLISQVGKGRSVHFKWN